MVSSSSGGGVEGDEAVMTGVGVAGLEGGEVGVGTNTCTQCLIT